MPWFHLSDQELLTMAQRCPEFGERVLEAVAEDKSEAAKACQNEARDDENFTPEWDGAVSFCEDGKAWVMTWELVDNPMACRECGAIEGTEEYGTVGDGFDGLCPSCADKADHGE